VPSVDQRNTCESTETDAALRILLAVSVRDRLKRRCRGAGDRGATYMSSDGWQQEPINGQLGVARYAEMNIY
jgi:hypothetical protein